MNAIWVFKILRQFFATIDKVVYWLLEQLTFLFDSLAKVRLFETGTINAFAERIYFFIAIIMLFKVSISIVQYIINPDNFYNNEKGMGKLIQSILLCLVLLVSVKYIFEVSYSFQKKVIDTNIIPRLILGTDIGNGNGIGFNQNAQNKKNLPFNILLPFVQFNTNISGIKYENGDYYCGGHESGWHERFVQEGLEREVNTSFATCLSNMTTSSSNTLILPGTINCVATPWLCGVGGAYFTAYNASDYSELLNIVDAQTKNDQFLFDYKILISTAAGIFAVIMYLNFCLDLGIRTIKYGFLQLIAPIPIISMIDPKSSKGGMMGKWAKQCISTYLGLFIRIFAVNFAILILGILTQTKDTILSNNNFANLVIIFSALMFAKELPKLISDLSGIDLSGNFKLNPLSRIPIAGKLATNAMKGSARAVGSLVGHTVGAANHLGFTALSAGTATLGSLGQAVFGAARGQGWNYNSDRIKRELKLGGDKMRNSAIGAANGFISNMGAIVGAKPKGIPTGSDRKLNANQEYKKLEKQLNYGRKIEDKIEQMRVDAMHNGSELTDEQINNAIYTNADFANDVTDVQTAKREMLAAKSRQDELLARANAGDISATAELSSASKAYADAETRYSSRKAILEKKGSQAKYAADYQRYEARKAYKDAYPTDGGNSSAVSEQYMSDFFTSERPSIESNNQPVGSMGAVTPPSRNGNKKNNNP